MLTRTMNNSKLFLIIRFIIIESSDQRRLSLSLSLFGEYFHLLIMIRRDMELKSFFVLLIRSVSVGLVLIYRRYVTQSKQIRFLK